MFLHTLRDLIIDDLGVYTELTYRCKFCNRLVVIRVTTECFKELRQGLPFRSVFLHDLKFSSKQEQLLNFEKGICDVHEQ